MHASLTMSGTRNPHLAPIADGSGLQKFLRVLAEDEDEAWKNDAACIGNYEPFHAPDVSGGVGEPDAERRAREAAAIAICGSCAVQDACRSYGAERGEKQGVWGGVALRSKDRKSKRASLAVPTQAAPDANH